MPKRKPAGKVRLGVSVTWLQLYHAKAETDDFTVSLADRIFVATLPCQSGNDTLPNVFSTQLLRCNFTMPKRKHESVITAQASYFTLQLYHAKAETCFSVRFFACLVFALQLYHAKAET